MENIYDIRKEKKLLYIFSRNFANGNVDISVLKQTAIAINLYYTETVDLYLRYIDNIPENIDVYIISSVPEIWNKINLYKRNKQNITILKKKNRGRDISALLVSFRPIALKYKYICYIHDKKEKYEYMKADIDLWIKNLWGNTVESETYIYNVLHKFEEDSTIGLLAPPEPIGEYMWALTGDTWNNDFANTVKLAKELQLKCNLDEKKPPITIGTVFWARSCALKKLFGKDWKNEDFQEEPLSDDGTLNHGVERILGYVAQDAGYNVGTIMTDGYAEEEILFFVGGGIRTLQRHLKKDSDINSLHGVSQMEEIDKKRRGIEKFFRENESVYLYGAGFYGRELLKKIRSWNYEPDGFVVSNGYKRQKRVDNLYVYELKEIVKKDLNSGIIISVDTGLQKEVKAALESEGYKNYISPYI